MHADGSVRQELVVVEAAGAWPAAAAAMKMTPALDAYPALRTAHATPKSPDQAHAAGRQQAWRLTASAAMKMTSIN